MRAQIQEQIDALNRLAELLHHKCENLIAADVEGIADDLEAAIRPQWVPVAERLPDRYQDVFACKGGLSVFFGHCDGDGVWVRSDNTIVRGVTHWHEIEYPEPPEAQQ